MPAKLNAALDAARRGFSVFPIAPDSKVPLLKENWLQIATTDEAHICQWWTDNPDANIAGLTGDKLVFDIDKRNGGLETWAGLKAIEDFPDTAWSTTAGGGAHMIYQMPEGQSVKGGTHKAGPGVDVKGHGGYILLPGSTINGALYLWGNQRSIAFAPAWAIERCQKAKERTDVAGKRLLEEDDIAREAFAAWIRDRAPRAEFGEIDDTTYKVVARGYDFGCSQETVHELTLGWNETHCNSLGDIDRLAVVVDSGQRNRDNAIGSAHPLAPGFEPVEIDESRAPAVTSLLSPSSKEGLYAENFFAAADLALSQQAEPLIKGVLDRGAMSILYGESNTGKTFIAIDISFHIAIGRAWTGRRTRQGCVVYVAAEGGRGVYKRLAALRKANPDLTEVPLFVVKFPIDLLHGPEHAKELVRICREVAEQSGQVLELIVIDTLSRAMSGGDENSSTDMGGIVKSFDAIRDVTAAHLMVIHHSGKDRAKGARGHSLLRAATDTEIEVERGRVSVTKQRDMDGEFKQAFRLKTVNLGRDSDGSHVTSCVVEFVTASVAEAEPAPVSRGLGELVRGLDAALSERPAQSFGIGFVAHIAAQMDGVKNPDQASDHRRPRTTLVGNMSELVEAGWFLKTSPDQYVRRLVGKSRPE